MTEFADLSEILNRLSGGNSGNPEALFINKTLDRRLAGTSSSVTSGGKTYSAWTNDGGNPPGGAVPGAVAVPTSATLGAVALTDATGGREKRLIAAMFSWGQASTPGSEVLTDIFLYDRLLHQSNLSGTVTTAQNVQNGSGVSLTRSTAGDGNEIWLEVYTAVGATPQTVTCSYTNQAGTAGRTTQTMPIGSAASTKSLLNTVEAARMVLQAGDTGVRSVETLTLSGSTGTAGAFGVTIAHRLTHIPFHDGTAIVDFTYGDSGTPVIEAGACLAMMWRTSSTGTLLPLLGVLATAER